MSDEQFVSAEMWQDMAERVAVIEATLRLTTEQNEKMDKRQQEMMAKLDNIYRSMGMLNSGAKAVMWLGGTLGVFTYFGAWILNHLGFKQ